MTPRQAPSMPTGPVTFGTQLPGPHAAILYPARPRPAR